MTTVAGSYVQTLTIAASGTTSRAFEAPDARAMTFFMPAALDSTSLKLQASPDGGTTWHDLYDDTATTPVQVSLVVAADRAYHLQRFSGCLAPSTYRIVMGSTETAAREIKVAIQLGSQ